MKQKDINIKFKTFEAYTYDDQSIRHMPKDFLWYLNLGKSKGLVRISANWYLVGTNSRETTFFSTRALMKWWWISMCLVREWRKGFFKIFIALELSQYTFMVSYSIPYSLSICFIHRVYRQQLPITIYSTSTVNKDIEFCFLLSQATRQ